MALYVEIKAADGAISRTRLEAGRTRLSVRLGDTYRIYDDTTGLAPQTVSVKRLDNMLVVDGLPAEAGAAAPVVEFAEFYTICSVGSPCQLVLEGASGAPTTVVDPGTAPIGALADGSFVLYDPTYTPAAAPAQPVFDGNTGRYALYGLGGLAVLGLAGGGGGGGGGNDDRPPPSDGTLRFTGATTFNTPLPTLRGDGLPGARILVRIDTDGDGRENATYATTVNDEGRWEINLQTATAETGSLGSGLSASNVIQINQTQGSGGTQTLAPFTYTFDNVPPAPPLIDAVTGDNVVNANEKSAGVAVSGTAEAGSLVAVTWGATTLNAVAGANGQWTVTFPAGSVPADNLSPVALSATATDPAGNVSSAASVSVAIDTRPGAPIIAPVAVDNVVNAAEKAAGVTVTGTAAVGSSVTVSWGASSETVAVDGNGQWSVLFAPTSVPADSGTPVAVIAIATDVFGTPSPQSSLPVTINTAPAALAVAAVATDNRVNAAEAGAGVTISGTSDPGATISVSWLGLPARPATANGAGAWSVTYAAGEIPAGNGVAQPYQVTATNPIGNSGSASGSVTIDTIAPAAPVISVAPIATDNIVNAAEKAAGVTVTGTVAEAGLVVSVSWGGLPAVASAPSDGSGNWSVFFAAASIPGDGPQSLVATTTDAAGNASAASAPRPMTISTTPPAAATAIVASGDNSVDYLEPYGVTGSAPAGTTVSVSIDGSAPVAALLTGTTWSTGAVFFNTSLIGGPGLITVTVTDIAGNTTPATQPFTYAPAIAFDANDAPAFALSTEMLFAGASLEGSDALFPLAGSAGSAGFDSASGINALIPFEDRSA